MSVEAVSEALGVEPGSNGQSVHNCCIPRYHPFMVEGGSQKP